jgi:hypothetical protein
MVRASRTAARSCRCRFSGLHVQLRAAEPRSFKGRTSGHRPAAITTCRATAGFS